MFEGVKLLFCRAYYRIQWKIACRELMRPILLRSLIDDSAQLMKEFDDRKKRLDDLERELELHKKKLSPEI